MRPKVGCLLRSQPKNKPAINAPPLVLKLMGMPPIWTESAPNKPPTRYAYEYHVRLVGRAVYIPQRLAAASTSCLVPTTSMTSPASTTVCASTGMDIPARLMLRILTPCMNFSLRITATVLPATVLRVIVTGNFSAGKSRSWASCTSGPIQLSSPMMYSRRPLSHYFVSRLYLYVHADFHHNSGFAEAFHK